LVTGDDASGVVFGKTWDVDRELVEVDEDDIVAWSLRLQALAELRSLAGADERPDPHGDNPPLR
jgi:hypothetical protein